MRIFIGGEIESSIYEDFRIARNHIDAILKSDDAIPAIVGIEELSFYFYILDNFDTMIKNKYIKRYQRIELEINVSFATFSNSTNREKEQIIIKSMLSAIHNYESKYIDKANIEKLYLGIKNILTI